MEAIEQFFFSIPTIINFLFFGAGLYALVKGSDLFVESSVFFAKKFRVSEAIIGLTLVSIGTSLPELATNINSALKGRTAIAMGNILGSNVTNISLVAGLAVVIVGVIAFDRKLFTRDIPIMLGATFMLVIFVFFFDGEMKRINRIEAFIMFFCLCSYLYYLVKSNQLEEEDVDPHHIKSSGVAILLFLVGGAGIFLGSELMIRNVIVIAKRFQISDGVIGATIVALGTSLPELSVTIMGIVKKRSNLSLGNIIGSNIFNILGILGITGMIKSLDIIDVLTGAPDYMTLFFTLPLTLIISLMLTLFMRTRWKLSRWEGVVFLLFYISFIVLNFTGLPFLSGLAG